MDLDVNERLERVLAHALSRRPDALFLTGDFCAAEPRQDMFHQLRPLLDATGVPYYITPGNHDDRGMLRNAFFLRGHNDAPVYGLVQVADRDFLFLDSSPGSVDDEQIEWLGRALDAYPDADLVMHHPPVPLGVTFMDNNYPLRDTKPLLNVLSADGRPRHVFCGHFHSGRSVVWNNLTVYLCPPTSFFIDPEPEEFRQEDLPPAYQLLEWSADGLRVVPTFVPENA